MLDNPKIEFEIICKDILNDDKFKRLSDELHHGITRYDHSIRVAKKTYKVAKFLRFKNYELTTKASLLHDYYLDNEIDEYTSKEKLFIHTIHNGEQISKNQHKVSKGYMNIYKRYKFDYVNNPKAELSIVRRILAYDKRINYDNILLLFRYIVLNKRCRK